MTRETTRKREPGKRHNRGWGRDSLLLNPGGEDEYLVYTNEKVDGNTRRVARGNDEERQEGQGGTKGEQGPWEMRDAEARSAVSTATAAMEAVYSLPCV